MLGEIQWLTENVELPQADYEAIGRWIEKVASTHGRLTGDLTYIFCDDPRILEVNRQFLNHDYFTDIITFDQSRGRVVRGDMYISLDTVMSNAEMIGATDAREFLRVVIHGVLHLCGINDKGPGEREIMEAHEDAALAMLEACGVDEKKILII